MTTKPRAKKFRIRRNPFAEAPARAGGGADGASEGASRGASGGDARMEPRTATADRGLDRTFAPAARDDGLPTPRFPPPGASDDVKSAVELAVEGEIDAIRREGLTGRQLRTARRVAQRHGIAATSDFDAVRLLRRQGIDPFQRANMLELVVSDSDRLPATAEAPGKLPQTVKPGQPPSTELAAEENRLRDIMRIQADLARRRRRRMTLLIARIAFFVLLPTFLAGYYYYRIATPFYATKAAFVINKAQAGGASAISGLFAGTSFAASQDSINAQAYLQSRDAMRRLDQQHGFKALFENPKIDPLQRLKPNASDEAAYRIYRRDVKVGYDPSEGIINLEVSTPDPKKSVEFANALIGYAQQRVDRMTLAMRDDQMAGAQKSYDEAEKKLSDANARVVELQQKNKVLSSDVEVSLLTSQISALNAELDKDKLNLQQILSQQTPSPGRVNPLKERIGLIEKQISDLRARLTVNNGNGESLAEISSKLLAAQAEVQTRQVMLSQALQALESARITANQQTRYFSVGVEPVAPDEPTYPRAFENTIVAFLIFAGLYLMLSMTASILREQVSA